MTISPGTSKEAGTSLTAPSLLTVAVRAAISFSALTAFSALYSCINPTTALRNTIGRLLAYLNQLIWTKFSYPLLCLGKVQSVRPRAKHFHNIVYARQVPFD